MSDYNQTINTAKQVIEHYKETLKNLTDEGENEMSGYDEGYRAGMQKMREVGQARIEELEKRLEVYEGVKGYPASCSGIVSDMSGTMEAMRKRIEELEFRNTYLVDDVVSQIVYRAEEAEAKLEKAVEALKHIEHYDIHAPTHARNTLKKLTGGKDE